jgi:hypothetical protein
MSREERNIDAKEFARKHWPVAVAATLTVGGAATWLLIRYIKERQVKKLTDSNRVQLDVLEKEATIGKEETSVLLETGPAVNREFPGSREIASAMVESIPDNTGKNAMTVLSQLKDPAQQPNTSRPGLFRRRH